VLAGDHRRDGPGTRQNVHDLRLAEQLLEGAKEEGWVLDGRNYWSPELSEKLGEEGLSLLAPYKSKKKEKQRWPG
jgi:hypothetical protein